jgi:hypothetical protein
MRSDQVCQHELDRMDDEGAHQTHHHRVKAFKRRFLRAAEAVLRSYTECGIATQQSLASLAEAHRLWKNAR